MYNMFTVLCFTGKSHPIYFILLWFYSCNYIHIGELSIHWWCINLCSLSPPALVAKEMPTELQVKCSHTPAPSRLLQHTVLPSALLWPLHWWPMLHALSDPHCHSHLSLSRGPPGPPSCHDDQVLCLSLQLPLLIWWNLQEACSVGIETLMHWFIQSPVWSLERIALYTYHSIFFLLPGMD